MGVFNGTLNSNEIFSALYNMIISQQVFADNVADGFPSLVDSARVDGTLYGDTKLYYSTDALNSVAWTNDAEAGNLLALRRPPEPACQALELDQFRMIWLTVDNYLSKRAWSTETAFSEFNSVMLGWLRDTKKIYDLTIYNTFIGTNITTTGAQDVTLTLPTDANDAEAQARLQGQYIAKTLADTLIALRDVTRDYNDNGFLRSYSPEDLVIVWNADWKNKITIMDLPTIFHKEGLYADLKEYVLPSRYFGTIDTTGVTTNNSNPSTTRRSLIETDYTVSGVTTHYFAGDLIKTGTTVPANVSYTEDSKVVFKIMHKNSVPYMSSFETATSFFNPRSLTETHYLIFGYNTLEHLKNYPFITAVTSA